MNIRMKLCLFALSIDLLALATACPVQALSSEDWVESKQVEKITVKDPKSLTTQDYSQLLHTSKELLLDWARKQNMKITAVESPVTASEDASLIHGLGGSLPVLGDTGATMAIFKDGKTIYLWHAVAGGIPKNENLSDFIAQTVKKFESIYGPSTAHDVVHGNENYNFNAGDTVLHLTISPYQKVPNSAYVTVRFELQSRLQHRLEKMQADGTMPLDWKPKFMFSMHEVPVPFGQSLSDFSKFLQDSRIEVIEGSQDQAMRCWTAPSVAMAIPGWGVARGMSFEFTNDSGRWRLKQAVVVQVLQMNQTWLKKRFEMTVKSLSSCFGKPEIQDGKARWSREGFYITLAIAKDENNIGYQREGALVLAFTQK